MPSTPEAAPPKMRRGLTYGGSGAASYRSPGRPRRPSAGRYACSCPRARGGAAAGLQCPPGTTYAVSLVAFNRPPGADRAPPGR